MTRLAEVSPAMRHRVGSLAGQYQSVTCDGCGTEFVAQRGALGKCPTCGRGDRPVPSAIAAEVSATIAASQALDQHLAAATDAAKEPTMAISTSRLKDKLSTVAAGSKELSDKIEARADAFIARKAAIEARSEQVFSPHEQVLDLAEQGLGEVEAALRALSNGGPPLDGSGASGQG